MHAVTRRRARAALDPFSANLHETNLPERTAVTWSKMHSVVARYMDGYGRIPQPNRKK
jgi:hypothetical protein